MIKLEELYDCADKYLTNEPDWQRFASGFRQDFGAQFALYSMPEQLDEAQPRPVHVIATSNPNCLEEFNSRQLLKSRPIDENSLAALEPSRRTDVISDEEVRTLGSYYEFMQKFAVFYLMIVPAKLPDGSNLSMVVWRAEDDEDFDDLEKQRLALFMRHLLAIVRSSPSLQSKRHDQVARFGELYQLTPAEQDVLASLLMGYSLRQISQESDRSYGTVRWHVKNILSKCHVSSQKNLLREFYALILE